MTGQDRIVNSTTNMDGATINGSVVATGSHSNASGVIGQGGELAAIRGLIAELRQGVTGLGNDPTKIAQQASLDGLLTSLDQQISAPAPDRQRISALLTGLLNAAASVVTLSGPAEAVAAAVRAHFGL